MKKIYKNLKKQREEALIVLSKNFPSMHSIAKRFTNAWPILLERFKLVYREHAIYLKSNCHEKH